MQSHRRSALVMERTRHPGIYKRGSRYVVVWRHRGRQHKSFHRTLAEAREAQGERRRTGERAPATRASFEDYAREWLSTYGGRTGRGLSETSRDAYRRSLEQHVIPFFDGYRVADVEPPDVRRLVKALEAKGLAPASVVKNLVPVKAMFATALEDGALRSNPTVGVRVNRRAYEDEEERVRALTHEQLAALLAELPDDWRLFFEMLAHTGLRISEAIALTWADVEFGERPHLRVRRQLYRGTAKRLKSRSSRRDLPLAPGIARRLWPQQGKPGEPLFATAAGTPLSDGNLRRRVLAPAARRASVPWVGFHTFRHTCASLLFEGGKDIKQVSAWLGHADPAFTLRTYIHLLDGGIGDADFLDRAVRVAPLADQVASAESGAVKLQYDSDQVLA